MSVDLKSLFDDLDLAKLRVVRPTKFVFLCGGVIATAEKDKPRNLRDYLCRIRPMRLPYNVVLAERATQLYRDTHYQDLISFEEDVARIAAVVLVIAESAGSLAELGAFASNETIQKSLRVIVQESYALEESFVRYGPIERVKKTREHLGVFPWRIRASGQPVIASIKPHYREIVNFIKGRIDAIPASTTYEQLGPTRTFYLVYWVIYISFVVTPSTLYERVQLLDEAIDEQDIRNKIYCMELAGWIARTHYGGKNYFYTRHDADPFDYAFQENVADNDSARRKVALALDLRKLEDIPNYIGSLAAAERTSEA